MYFVFIIILILLLIYLNPKIKIEKFKFPYGINTYKYTPFSKSNIYGYYIPWYNDYTNFPWNNTKLGNTSNMSYDIRGDPIIIPKTDYIWNNGTVFPIHNRFI